MPAPSPVKPARNGVAPLRSRTRLEFIEAAGNLCRRVGLPRSLGQIYGLLFFTPQPLSLDEIAEALDISKGSASTGTRQLAGWGAIRQVWVPGDRKDFFEVVPELGGLIRNAYREFLKPRLLTTQQRFERMEAALDQDLADGSLTPEDHALCAERLKGLRRVQKRLQLAVPVLERLL
ncbi:MAG TPA: hypothetical protein PKM73_05555 [Verrucomicrobiota bacterium]|nr:hypothetical protein [Verrucomicrobiota bacterium]